MKTHGVLSLALERILVVAAFLAEGPHRGALKEKIAALLELFFDLSTATKKTEND